MELPAQIGKYEIIGLIGRGGMGVVYQARDNVLGRLVALKVMTSDLTLDPEVHIRFLREARSVAAMQHPNIVVVYELGEHNESPFIVMEFLDGVPLDRLIRNHVPLSVLQKTDIVLEVAKALQYAHDKGIIHRDVKPGNIMRLRDGSVKVVDFGIAHLADQTITKTGMVMGTLGYLAPEQLNGEGIDRRTDIFSLGVVLYELLSGRLPFEGAKPAEVMMKILLEAPSPLPPNGDVDPLELQPILDKALAKKKEERYQTCSEFAEALTRLRRKFAVQSQLAAREEERKALLAQLQREGGGQPEAAGRARTVRQERVPRLQRYVWAAFILAGVALAWFAVNRLSSVPAESGGPRAISSHGIGATQQQQGPSPSPCIGVTQQQGASPEVIAKAAKPFLLKLKTNPDDFDTLAKLGNLYYDGKAFPQAIEYYTKALKVRPGTPDILTDLGTSYWYMCDPDMALENFQKSLAIRPNNPETLFNLGIVKWASKKDSKGAIAAWEQLLQTNPHYPQNDQVQMLIKRARM